MTTTTGLDMPTAKGIPAGATITRVYWAVPTDYTSGPEFETEPSAIMGGIAHREALIAKHEAHVAEHGGQHFVPERFSIDLRWTVAYPAGGGLDFTVSRTTYETLAEAREHLARIEKYAKH